MTALHFDVEGTVSSSISPVAVIATLVFLSMVSVVGYLAWQSRKKAIDEERRAEEEK
jgi:hypothetical protein